MSSRVLGKKHRTVAKRVDEAKKVKVNGGSAGLALTAIVRPVRTPKLCRADSTELLVEVPFYWMVSSS